MSGVAFAILPSPLGGLLVGRDADSPGSRLFIQAFGARDALLGAGVLRAADSRQSQRQWLLACALADVFDAAATVGRYRHLPSKRRALTLVASAVPAVLNLTVARQLH